MKQLSRFFARFAAGFTVSAWSIGSGCSQAPPPVAPQVVPQPDPIYRLAGEVQLPDNRHWDFLVLLMPDPSEPEQYLGTVDIPLQALHGTSLHQVHFEPGRVLEFTLALPGQPTFRASLSEGQSTDCRFTQSGHVRPCVISPVGPEPIEPLGAPLNDAGSD